MSRKWWRKRTEIRAVHDNNLEHLLSSLGVLEQIEGGSCSCLICNSPVNLTNLGAVLPTEKGIGFICDMPSCIANISPPLEEGDEALD